MVRLSGLKMMKKKLRNNFPKLLGLIGVSVASFGVSGTVNASPATEEMNVVFIVADDLMDYFSVFDGQGGRLPEATPNLKRLAMNSAVFNRAYSTAAVCSPARASIYCGLYPHTSEYYLDPKNHWFRNPVLGKTKTLPVSFRDSGWKAAGTGKTLHGHPSANQPNPYNQDINQFSPGKKGPQGLFSPHWVVDGKNVCHPDVPEPMNNGNWGPSFGSFESALKSPQKGSGKWMVETGNWKTVDFDPHNPKHKTIDETVAGWAAEQIRSFAKKKQKFFITVGFTAPHTPLHARQKYFDRFPLDKIVLPERIDDAGSDYPNVYETSNVGGLGSGVYKRLVQSFPDRGDRIGLRKYIQAYLACIAATDDVVGQVLNAVESDPSLRNNTIIIFTGDHGFHMGQRENLWKYTLWEEATRVPLIMRVPGVTRAGSQIDEPVSHVDIYPTLMDLCGLRSVPQGLDGHSLRPLLENPDAGVWDGPEGALSLVQSYQGKAKNNQHYSVRTKNFRYTRYFKGMEEFYDTRKDPFEWNNRINDRSYTADIAHHKALLEHLVNSKAKPAPKYLNEEAVLYKSGL